MKRAAIFRVRFRRGRLRCSSWIRHAHSQKIEKIKKRKILFSIYLHKIFLFRLCLLIKINYFSWISENIKYLKIVRDCHVFFLWAVFLNWNKICAGTSTMVYWMWFRNKILKQIKYFENKSAKLYCNNENWCNITSKVKVLVNAKETVKCLSSLFDSQFLDKI